MPDEPSPLSGHLAALAAFGTRLRCPRDALLIQEGDPGDSIYIILSGRVRVFSAHKNGREVTYGVYGPGDYFGEMSLDGERRSASVVTMEPTECSVVARQTVLNYLQQHPDFAIDMMLRLIRRTRAATQSAREIALNDVYGRLAHLLNSLAQPDGTGRRVIRDRLTHQALAHRVGCSREMVSRLMKDLERGGYLCREGDVLVLLRTLPERW